MTPHLTFLEPPPPLPPGRNVHCNCCGMLVRVYDIPPHVDEDRFVCGACLVPVQPEPVVGLRRPDYDPASAPIPF